MDWFIDKALDATVNLDTGDPQHASKQKAIVTSMLKMVAKIPDDKLFQVHLHALDAATLQWEFAEL